MFRNFCNFSCCSLSLKSVHVCPFSIRKFLVSAFKCSMNLFVFITWLCSFAQTSSDCEVSAGLSSTDVSVWSWDIWRIFKYWCRCLILIYLQAFQALVSMSDCDISAGLSSTGVSVRLWDICRPFKCWCQCLIVRYLQAFQMLVSVSDCEITAGLSSTGVVSDVIQRKPLLPTPNIGS